MNILRRFKNKFDAYDVNRWYVGEVENCFYCNGSGWDAIHHVTGKTFSYEESILNYCPIHNHICHLYNMDLQKKETKDRLLKNIFKFLMFKGYILKKTDKEFISHNLSVYKDLIKI